jgi:hypothetical protein
VYESRETMANAFTKEAFTLLALGIATVGTRTAARANTIGFKHFQLDDYL